MRCSRCLGSITRWTFSIDEPLLRAEDIAARRSETPREAVLAPRRRHPQQWSVGGRAWIIVGTLESQSLRSSPRGSCGRRFSFSDLRGSLCRSCVLLGDFTPPTALCTPRLSSTMPSKKQNQACQHCHERKIRCNGAQTDGACDGCRVAGTECVLVHPQAGTNPVRY